MAEKVDRVKAVSEALQNHEKRIFDKKLPEIMVGDPRHEDRYMCHGCGRIMTLMKLNDRIAFYHHKCGSLDDKWVLLVITSFAKDLYKRMIEGIIAEENFDRTKDTAT